MNWEAISAVGEMASALVVMITLIYLATQVKYAKMAAADVNRLTRAQGVCDMQLFMASNPGLHQGYAKANNWDVWYRQMAEAFDMTVEEAIHFDSLSLYWFWLHWGQFSSTNTKADLNELGEAVGKFYSSPFLRYAWQNSPFAKPLFDDNFVAFVDRSLQIHSPQAT